MRDRRWLSVSLPKGVAVGRPVACEIACAGNLGYATRFGLRSDNWRMTMGTSFALALALALAAFSPPIAAVAGDDAAALVKRGEYLTTVLPCTDCHTYGGFSDKPDMTRYLAGSDVGFEMPGLGFFYGPNLTPDKETGLGTWSSDDIVRAIRTGERPDGRILAPIMPWRSFAALTDDDAKAIAAYLKSLPAVSYRAPGPLGPAETPTAPFFRIISPPSK
jgi:mono/diheme cytochrome c family protein